MLTYKSLKKGSFMDKRILNEFSNNKKIKNKVLIITLYTELYNRILINSSFTEKCFSSTFELTIASINLQEKEVNVKTFMKLFLDLLKITNIAKIQVINEIILHFEKEMDSIMDSLNYVCVITEQEKLPLDKQLDIILEFKKYMTEIQNCILMLFELKNTPELIGEIAELASLRESLTKTENANFSANEIVTLNPIKIFNVIIFVYIF